MSRTILVADDSVTIQKAVAIALAHEPSLSLVAVNNGRDAVIQARQLRPALVLADHVMPEGSGYEVAEALRADGIPVMMLAGGSAPFDEARALAAGCIGHVNKPFDCQTIAERVMAAVGANAGAPAPQASPAPATMPQMPAFSPAAMAAPAAMPPSMPPAMPTYTPAPAPTAAAPMPAASAMPPDFGAAPPVAAPAAASMAPDFAASPAPFGAPAAPFGAPAAPSPAAPPLPTAVFGNAPMPPQPAAVPSAPPAFPESAFDAANESARAVTFPPQPAGDPLPPSYAAQVTPAFTPTPAPAAAGVSPPPVPSQSAPAVEAFEIPTESLVAPTAARPALDAGFDPMPSANSAAMMQNIAEVAEPSVRAAVAAETAGASPSVEVLSAATREVIERVVWEVVPELAETLIREEISRLLAERQH